MFKVLETYEEDGLGLPYAVTLVNAAEVEIDDDTEEVLGVSVPDMEGLAAAVAMARALLPAGLLPEEVKFFRTVLDMKSKDMADVLMMDPATYSRWENGKQDVGQWADKQMRFAVVTVLRDRFPHFSVDPKSVVSLKPKKLGRDKSHQYCAWFVCRFLRLLLPKTKVNGIRCGQRKRDAGLSSSGAFLCSTKEMLFGNVHRGQNINLDLYLTVK